ncbi:ketopantoate reductase PanE/ApbA C terminal-domain-containing protein [Aspergillus novoparasiticus]|uniref:2-dehydropantoate 2-reductase n=1 Tax=Aspergillus novoparasiticus TaxID=986946 RepID=A0A5N6EFB7_9EURO|nr:ketopantoate reductase PanE/ApbA C terminal-domain-containing protein [Aspergillus novoparasiticus]
MSPRIHIIGLGSVGVIVANALASLRQRPDLTLMFHRRLTCEGQLSLTVNGIYKNVRSGFDVEEFQDGHWRRRLSSYDDPHVSPIDTLIVAVKANYTRSVLSTVKHRLSRNSTILFLQNGMGILEEVDESVFPDPAQRPHYMIGINTNGTSRTGQLSAHHTSLAMANGTKTPGSFALPDPMIDALSNSPNLNARLVSAEDVLHLQLKKLAINAVLNPLTALLECKIGMLYSSQQPWVRRLIELMLEEISAVLRALPLPFQTSLDLEAEFAAKQLTSMVEAFARRLPQHSSSMMQDIGKGSETEIAYLNGFLIRLGMQLGINCPVNNYIMQAVLKKQEAQRYGGDKQRANTQQLRKAQPL